MDIGFTGTQIGMSENQKKQLIDFLNHTYIRQFHHGDCIGADEQADLIVISYPTIQRHCHPPSDPKKRAFRTADVFYPEQEYLTRNKEIVKHCDLLIVAPSNNTEQLRSGTWSTKRYAERIGREFKILER